MSSDELVEHIATTSTDATPTEPPSAAAARSRGNPQNRRGGRPNEGSDERKKRKPGGDRRDRQGFSDGIERAACSHYHHRLPPDFPVQHRTGVAALVPRVVARRTSAILLCDCVHEGPHSWPNGDLVEDASE
jgi:hypothetical protein